MGSDNQAERIIAEKENLWRAINLVDQAIAARRGLTWVEVKELERLLKPSRIRAFKPKGEEGFDPRRSHERAADADASRSRSTSRRLRGS